MIVGKIPVQLQTATVQQLKLHLYFVCSGVKHGSTASFIIVNITCLKIFLVHD